MPTFVWVLLLGIFVFYPIGIWEGRTKGYKKRKAEEEQEKKDNPPQPMHPTTITVEDPGLMRIKNENGFLALDLDGIRVNTSAMTADQRKRLIEMLNVIRPWLEGRPAPTPPPASIPVPAPIVAPSTQLKASPTPAPAPQASTPAPQIPPARQQPAAAKDAPPAPAPLGIVGQIDSVLQARLVGTPLEGRGISLGNSPEGGVLVYVGSEKYQGVDDVPDPQIKAAIRAAISEWENKYTPGL